MENEIKRERQLMKMTGRKLGSWTVAVLSLALANGARAAEDEEERSPKAPPLLYEEATGETAPARHNKASGIIGMEVRNRGDERLGTYVMWCLIWGPVEFPTR